MFLAFFFSHSSTAARMHHPTERCRSLANFSKPWSCSALSRILKISILMYDSVLHNDYRCQPQSATRLPPPEARARFKRLRRTKFLVVHPQEHASWLLLAQVLVEEGGHDLVGFRGFGKGRIVPEGVREGFEDYQLGVHAGTEVGAVQDRGSAQEQIAAAGDEERWREHGEIRVEGREQRILEIG